MSSDNVFSTLPKRVQREIDESFDVSTNPLKFSGFRQSKRRKISVEPETVAGGFLVASGDSSDIPETHARPTQIPFELIPSALQRLDLPPDDEEVISVFRNAAEGWTPSSIESQITTDPQGKYVNRDTWRAVCAVLLENRSKDENQDSEDGDVDISDGELDSSNEYDVELEGDSDDDVLPGAASDDDEYDDQEEFSGRRTRGAKGKSKQAISLEDLKTQSHALTKRQKQTCLDTFAMFFPDTPLAGLEDQKIMLKDLQRVAKLFNEKLKADEMLEMLEMFSSSADKSMNFEDFSCMMMAAKLA